MCLFVFLDMNFDYHWYSSVWLCLDTGDSHLPEFLWCLFIGGVEAKGGCSGGVGGANCECGW